MEKQEEEQRRAEIIRLEKEAKRRKIREKEALIDELMFSQENAKNIINTFTQNVINTKEEIKPSAPVAKVITVDDFSSESKLYLLIFCNFVFQQVSQFSTGVKFTRGSSALPPLPQIIEGPLYVYKPPADVIVQGPSPPECKDLETTGYLRHIR